MTLMDSISLRHIEVRTQIGVPDAERAKPQRLLIDLELFQSTSDVAKTDDLRKGIDYDAVTRAVVELGKTERKTVERFAEDVASMILATFKPTGGVTVSVWKNPDLPLESACVTIHRP